MAVEFRQVRENNVGEIAEWCDGRAVVEHDALDHSVTYPAVNVPVNDGDSGVERAQIGDTIKRNHDGTFIVYKTSKME